MIIKIAPKMPPNAQIITVSKVIVILSPSKNFVASNVKIPSTAFIAS